MSSIFIQLAYVEKSLPFVHSKLCLEEYHVQMVTQQLRTLVEIDTHPLNPSSQTHKTERQN